MANYRKTSCDGQAKRDSPHSRDLCLMHAAVANSCVKAEIGNFLIFCTTPSTAATCVKHSSCESSGSVIYFKQVKLYWSTTH